MIAFLLFLAALAQVPLSAPAQLAGRLTLPDGKPASGIRITAIEASADASGPVTAAGITATDTDGKWRLTNLPPGRYFITAGLVDFPTYYPSGLKIGGASPVVVGGSAVQGIDFVLMPVPDFKVQGRVAGVRNPTSIRLEGPGGGANTLLAADGSFEFAHIRPGSYVATLPPDFLQRFSFVVENKDLTGIEFRPLPVADISGNVVVEGDGLVPRFSLSFSGPFRATADLRQNQFRQRLPVGVYRVALESSLPVGYSLKSILAGSTDLLQSPLEIAAETPVPPIIVTLGTTSQPPWVRVIGSLPGAASNGFGSARASLSGDSLSVPLQAPIRSDGSFEFPMALPGEYSIRVHGDLGIRTPAIDVVIPNNDSREVRITLPRLKVIRGRIQVAEGAPIPRVVLSVSNPSGSINDRNPLNPENDGTFRVAVPEGEYLLLPDVGAYSILSFTYGSTDLLNNPLKAAAADSQELRLAIAPPSGVARPKVSGRVVGPIPDIQSAHVVLSRGGSRPIEASLDPDGRFEFPQVPQGNYSVRLNSSVANVATIRLEVGQSDITGVELVVPRTRTLKLQTFVDGGGSVPAVRLLIDGGRQGAALQNLAFGVTLTDGEHRVTVDVPVGYSIKAFTSGNVDLTREPLNVGVKTADLVLTLSTTGSMYNVKGRVTGAQLNSGLVSLNSTEGQFRGHITQQGTFEIVRVPPGTYRVVATLSAVGQGVFTVESSVTVSNADVTNLEIALTQQHVTQARVKVEGGVLFPGSFALTLAGSNGSKSFLFYLQGKGMYQASLPIGESRVSLALSPPGYSLKSLTYGPVDLLRDPLKIAASDSAEIQAVFSVAAASLRKVSGRITGIDPSSVTALILTIAGSPVETPIRADGTFEVSGLPRGTYSVTIRPGSRSSRYLERLIAGRISVTNVDISGIEIMVPREIEVVTRIVVDGGATAATPLFVDLRTTTTSGSAVNPLRIAEQLPQISLPEGEQTIQVQTVAPGYVVKSIMYGETNLLREPLVLKGEAANQIVVTLSPTP